MVAVKFNAVEEFCDELEKEASEMPRKIVRLTNSTRLSPLSPSIKHLSVIATFLITLPSGQHGIVRLERYCGDLWGMGRDAKVLEEAERLAGVVSATCKKLGLEVRAGVLEDVPVSAAG